MNRFGKVIIYIALIIVTGLQSFSAMSASHLKNTGHSHVPGIMALPPDWYPESLAVAPEGIYVGSWRQGAIALIHPDGGEPEIIVPPGTNGLTNTQGLLVDKARHTLWVCSGNLGYTTVPRHPSALLSFELKTGKVLQRYELPGGGYCNDLALDSQGRIYVTDSLQPRILRLTDVSSGLEVWKEDAVFAAGTDGFFLNGIAIYRDDVYVSAVAAVPYLLHINIRKNGIAGDIGKIDLPRVLKNADAIRSLGPDKLLIFESNAFGKDGAFGGQISLLDIKETPRLKTIVSGLNDPSSGLVIGNRVYFIESKYSLLLREKADDTSRVPVNVPFAIESRELVY